jgi:hypothetical protein
MQSSTPEYPHPQSDALLCAAPRCLPKDEQFQHYLIYFEHIFNIFVDICCYLVIFVDIEPKTKAI